MSDISLSPVELLALALTGAAIALGVLRLALGPTTPDRVVAADTLGVITIAGLVWLSAIFKNGIYLDVALVYGALAFVGVVAIARAIEPDNAAASKPERESE